MQKEAVSLEQVKARMPELLARLEENPELAVAAASNPLLALQELGLELELDGQLELQDRARFEKRDIAKRKKLRSEIFEHVGHSFNLHDEASLFHTLFDELGLPKPTKLASPLDTTDPEDPLEPLREAHPVMPPLLAYRRLDGTRPRFAPLELYRKLRSGELNIANLRMRASLKQ